MNITKKISRLALLGAVFACFTAFDAEAQFSGFAFGKKGGAETKRAGAKKPTAINSDSMDIDITNNKITLIGNVDVDDPEMNIKCRKMIIYLEDQKETGKDKKTSAAADKNAPVKKDDSLGGGKSVNRIECTGDVVITRSTQNQDASVQTQKAYAGEAVYNLREDTITLKDKPVIINGNNTLKGRLMTLYVKTERVIVVGATATGADGFSNQK